jgi:hypothetical protein
MLRDFKIIIQGDKIINWSLSTKPAPVFFRFPQILRVKKHKINLFRLAF